MYYNSVSNAALEAALGAAWQRSRTILNNVANEDTPGYKAKRYSFEGTLANEISRINQSNSGISRREAVGRLSQVNGYEYELEGLEERADGNNVSIENEQIEMARLQIQYDAIQAKIVGHYTNLQTAIGTAR